MLLRRLATLDVSPGQDRPRVTLMSFTNTAKILANRQIVSPHTLHGLISKVKAMRPLYTTNIKAAMRSLCNSMVPGNHNIGILLTDGQPTDSEGHITDDDPAEYLDILKEYKGRYSSFSTLGYGHKLSHQIMLQTAREGGGVASWAN